MVQYKQILVNGLWAENPGLVRFLGICPLLAVSNTVENGLGLGLATLGVLVLSNLTVSLIRTQVPDPVRLPVFVLVIASLVTAVDLLTQAWFYDLWLSLGIFIPLIVTNCVILARAESFASRQSVLPALVDGVAYGLGFCAVLIALGALREWAGQAFLLALLPPGAFFALGLLVAAHRFVGGRTRTVASEAVPRKTAA